MEQQRSSRGRSPDRAAADRRKNQRIVQPLWVVHGGMQAVAVRRLLAADPSAPYRTVGTPSADTATVADVPAVFGRLNSADVVITEDLPAGYRGLPLGTEDILSHVRPGVPVIAFPRLVYAGLHPFQVEATPELGGLPPLVPYHDLRLVAQAARLPSVRSGLETCPDRLREFAALQLLRLRMLECEGVGGSAAIRPAGIHATHAVDRPGNALLVALARTIQVTLGVAPTAKDPGTPLLSRYVAPVEDTVADALGLPHPTARHWGVQGRPVQTSDIQSAHAAWYRRRPDVVRAVLAAHQRRFELLGML